MNDQIAQQLPIIEQTLNLREQLFDALTADDLAFTLPNNPSLGELCKEMGEVQHAYIESFKTFAMDFSYKHSDDGIATDLAGLRAWAKQLNGTLVETLGALSDEDLMRPVERGGDFSPPAMVQIHIFREAILIFCAKVSVYLRAMEKPLPGLWPYWIG